MRKRKTLHLISQAHLDPVWLWPVRDGCGEALSTVQSAVDRAAESPAFKFTRSSAAIYRWVEEMDPVLWKSVRKLVKERRWEVIGGWVEQPDCNLPSTESFIRQGLYGGEYFQRKLNVRSRIGYNVDSFGHSGGLPQILRQAGMDSYVFVRPSAENTDKLHSLFWWESPDGSRVLALRINSYSQSYGARADDIERYIRAIADAGFMPGFDDAVFFLGVGNHGGGPTREHLARIAQLQDDAILPRLEFSTVEKFLARLKSSAAIKKIPVIRHELQHVFRGCYSSTGIIKELHRVAEKSLYAAEGALVLAAADNSRPAIGKRILSEAWWRLLFNQFHDILAGTCIEQALEETRHRFGATLNKAEEVTRRAIFTMARRVDTRREKGSVLFVANPLPWKRTALIQFDAFITPDGTERITYLESPDGERIRVQWTKSDSSFGPWFMPWGKLTAALPVPAGGYRVFRVGGETLPKTSGHLAMEQFTDKEEAPIVPVVKRKIEGKLLSSLKTARGQEILRAPMRLVVCQDKSDSWGQNADSFREELGKPKILSTEIIEEGPHLTLTRQRLKWRNSEIQLDLIRYGHTSQIGLRLRINWQEKRQMLKLEISTALLETMVYAKMAGEIARRPPDGNENPCHDWVAMEGKIYGEKTTVALLNRSSYSYDVLDGVLRMTLIRSVAYAEMTSKPVSEIDGRFMDQGWQERFFWLVAGSGTWSTLGVDRLAQEWQVPAQTMLDSGHPGTEPWEKSTIEISPAAVSILALKPAEDGNGFILRVQELAGRKTEASIHWDGVVYRFTLAKWQIKTWRIIPGKVQTKFTECLPSEFFTKIQSVGAL